MSRCDSTKRSHALKRRSLQEGKYFFIYFVNQAILKIKKILEQIFLEFFCKKSFSKKKFLLRIASFAKLNFLPPVWTSPLRNLTIFRDLQIKLFYFLTNQKNLTNFLFSLNYWSFSHYWKPYWSRHFWENRDDQTPKDMNTTLLARPSGSLALEY